MPFANAGLCVSVSFLRSHTNYFIKSYFVPAVETHVKNYLTIAAESLIFFKFIPDDACRREFVVVVCDLTSANRVGKFFFEVLNQFGTVRTT